MKKKVLGLTIAGIVALSGVVSAASMWGTYKGNDIIRLTVDGAPVKVSDVPAISYNGRTMLPIYLLQQAGIDYTWDQSKKTVNIKSLKNNALNDFAINDIFKQVNQVKQSIQDEGIQLTDLYLALDGSGSTVVASYQGSKNSNLQDALYAIALYSTMFDVSTKISGVNISLYNVSGPYMGYVNINMSDIIDVINEKITPSDFVNKWEFNLEQGVDTTISTETSSTSFDEVAKKAICSSLASNYLTMINNLKVNLGRRGISTSSELINLEKKRDEELRLNGCPTS